MVEAGTRRPIAAADVVSTDGASAATDAKGLYRISLLPGDRILTFSAPGFAVK